MGPVVVSNSSVVLLNSDEEPHLNIRDQEANCIVILILTSVSYSNLSSPNKSTNMKMAFLTFVMSSSEVP